MLVKCLSKDNILCQLDHEKNLGEKKGKKVFLEEKRRWLS